MRAVGPLKTPTWHALDPRKHFTCIFEIIYGGILSGTLEEVAVVHTLESWPVGSLPVGLYRDIRDAGKDPLTVMLEALCCGEGDEGPQYAMELLRRSERHWIDGPGGSRRDCRRGYQHGR